MLRICVPGIEGDLWADPALLNDNAELRHPSFREDVREVLRDLWQTFVENYPVTFEVWEEGFRKDTNPYSEIALWLVMQEMYLKFTAGRGLNLDQKADVYRLVIACVNNGAKFALANERGVTLSKTRAKAITDHYESQGNDALGRALARTGRFLFDQAGGVVTRALDGLFGPDGVSMNPFSDPRPLLFAADAILGVDAASQGKFPVYGRAFLEQIAGGSERASGCVLRVELGHQADDLERLCAVVQVMRGRHEYQGGEGGDGG